MRRLLSSPHNNGLSLVLRSPDIKHAVDVVVISWQWSEHGFTSIWPYKRNIRRPVASAHDNGRSMVIYDRMKKHVTAGLSMVLYGRIRTHAAFVLLIL